MIGTTVKRHSGNSSSSNTHKETDMSLRSNINRTASDNRNILHNGQTLGDALMWHNR
jgi:hypothetical protein